MQISTKISTKLILVGILVGLISLAQKPFFVGSNTPLSSGIVATPTDTPGQNTYSSAQTVALADATSGSTICYTTNGTTPAAATPGTCSNGTTYSGTFSVSVTTTVKALGTKSGLLNSGVLTSIYTITTPWQTGIGFNFRNTSGYVTDSANETYVLGQADAPYPTTRTINGQSVTFGWWAPGSRTNCTNGQSTSIFGENASTIIDHRLAGANYVAPLGSNICILFRVDLPATGVYNIRVALGDQLAAYTQTATIRDNNTSVGTVAASTATTSAHFLDATGTLYTTAAWPGSNTIVSPTFASQIFNFMMSDNTSYNTLAHIFIQQQ